MAMKPSQPLFYVLALALVGMVCIAYSNHFDNPFHFDDEHTIVTNYYIRDLKNIPKFFTDATTSSSLPANQAYRPGVTTLNAIDVWLGGKCEAIARAKSFREFLNAVWLGGKGEP